MKYEYVSPEIKFIGYNPKEDILLLSNDSTTDGGSLFAPEDSDEA